LLVIALPTPTRPIVGDDLDDGVDVVFRLQFVGPAALDGAAGQAGQADFGDFHNDLYLTNRSADGPLR
jgi:hypothetical protein